jgi:thioredoxin-like negative regulator of GroEL
MVNTLLFHLEKDIAKLLIYRMKHLNMSIDRASQIAKFILLSLPEKMTEEELKGKLPLLNDEFDEIAAIITKYIEQEELNNKKYTIDTVHQLLENGKLDHASQLLNSYFSKQS